MAARLYYTSANPGPEPIEELTVVRLLEGGVMDAGGHLPAGSLGAVVFVHDGGLVYEVEFTDPLSAVVTLQRKDIEPTETTRDSVANAVGLHHRRS